jgi:hypothetical protein
MKKIFITALLAFASTFALATDVTVGASRNLSKNADAVDVAVSTKVLGPVSAELGFTSIGAANVGFDSNALKDRNSQFSAGVIVPIVALGPVQTSAKVAAVYVSPSFGTAGYGVRYGLEAAMPIYKSLSVVGTVTRLDAVDANRVHRFEGNTAGIGARYTF